MRLIGDIIREKRREKGLTQKELAEKIGVSSQVLSHIERRGRNPNKETLEKIISILELEESNLFPKKDCSKRIYESIGEFIKKERIKKDVNQRELAKEIGITHEHLSKIEKGYHRPNSSTILKIAQFFDVDAVYLLELAGYKEAVIENQICNREQKIKNMILKYDFSENDVEIILRFSETLSKASKDEKEWLNVLLKRYKKLTEKEKKIITTILS